MDNVVFVDDGDPDYHSLFLLFDKQMHSNGLMHENKTESVASAAVALQDANKERFYELD